MPRKPAPEKVEHKLTAKFEWASPMELTIDDAESLGLVKHVLCREGKLKSGETYNRDTIKEATGALRAQALRGEAINDIDHYKEKLPETYETKYGAGINDPYPIGHIIDAHSVEGKDGKVEIQAISSIHNPVVYNLVKEGKVKGNSVVDYYRKLTCETDGCSYEGSTFMYNTLVLDEVPNSDGTWIAPITADDIGTIITHVKKAEHAKGGIMKILQDRLKEMHTQKNQNFEALNEYMTDGVWNDGVDSIKAFLLEHKDNMTEEHAQSLADFMFANPTEFSMHQLAHLSGSDLLAWAANSAKIIELTESHNALSKMCQDLRQNYNVLLQSNPELKLKMRHYVENIKRAEKDD